MTARSTHQHPGTATPIGGSGGSTGGTSGTFSLNPKATVPIIGSPQAQAQALEDLRKMAATYISGGARFADAHAKVKGIHDSVFPQWEGAASREGERATKMAVGRAKYAVDALQTVGSALNVFQIATAAAVARQAPALTQLNALIPKYNANPADLSVQGAIMNEQQISLSAQDEAAIARRTVEAAIVHSSTVVPYTLPPTFTDRFDPITAAILDSLVVHGHVSRHNAQLIAGRLHQLSGKHAATFAKLEATATTDKQRGKLYTELAKGTPMSKIVASDKAFHAAASAHHAPAVSASGGTAAPVGAAILPASTGGSGGNPSAGKKRQTTPPSSPPPPHQPKGWHPPMKPGYVPPAPKPAHKPSGALSPKLPDYSNPASWPKPAAPAPVHPAAPPPAPAHHSSSSQSSSQSSTAAKNAAFGPMP